jgi:hypothetical protein
LPLSLWRELNTSFSTLRRFNALGPFRELKICTGELIICSQALKKNHKFVPAYLSADNALPPAYISGYGADPIMLSFQLGRFADARLAKQCQCAAESGRCRQAPR